ncbi:hypothetical protein GGTG_09282 [Gaeumannomyces tritici R3-111a-1]|uniref:Uncharacterized protein n=1 Tax=Gaeumannomyces tritici (strain R3-111a-1) TaxID=644352 RepID=J3P6Y6_GAET3|nr:hypothetical protein GGTG_09282 [Gaeumannomyces tritici R3-111a-1]EJT72416.1 hypothetical protein GGTG_09282 [Gaeumannomyces tritici R3-111a-1]
MLQDLRAHGQQVSAPRGLFGRGKGQEGRWKVSAPCSGFSWDKAGRDIAVIWRGKRTMKYQEAYGFPGGSHSPVEGALQASTRSSKSATESARISRHRRHPRHSDKQTSEVEVAGPTAKMVYELDHLRAQDVCR